MHPEPMISDAQYRRSRIHEFHSRRRLVAQAAPDGVPHHGFRYLLGSGLIAIGNRLQGIAPTLPDHQPLPSPTPAVGPTH